MLDEVYLGFSDYNYESRRGTRIKAVAKENSGYWVLANTFEDDLPPKGTAFAISPELSWVKKINWLLSKFGKICRKYVMVMISSS